MSRFRSPKQRQQGASLIVVLVLLGVLLLGVVSLARQGEVSALLAGNAASKSAALQASEVGLADANAAIQALDLASLDADIALWYRATYTRSNDLAGGLPGTGVVQWDSASTVLNTKTVGAFTVRYVVERMCSVAVVTDANTQCMVKVAYAGNSRKSGTEALQSDPGRQYRITVHVAGAKGARTVVQGLSLQ